MTSYALEYHLVADQSPQEELHLPSRIDDDDETVISYSPIPFKPKLKSVFQPPVLPLAPLPTPVSPLHQACCRQDVTYIELARLLRQYSMSVEQPAVVETMQKRYIPSKQHMVTMRRAAPFQYPLNLAIHAGVNVRCLRMLIQAAPSVLLKPDGPLRETPLHLLLRRRPLAVKLVNILLLAEPRSAALLDRLRNTPLHTAVRSAAHPTIVRRLLILSPESLLQANFHGKTPLQLAQQTSQCSEAVSELLLEQLGDESR